MPSKKTPTLYKATRPDGTDFRTGEINYAAALESKATIKHPLPGDVGDSDAFGYLSVTDSPMDIPGSSWPLRLFEVKVVGKSWYPSPSGMPHKVAAHAVKVIREVSPHLVYGPEGKRIAEIVDQFRGLSWQVRDDLYFRRPMDFDSAWYRVRKAAGSLGVWSDPARFDLGLFGVGWAAGLGGALALLVRGIDESAITTEDYEILTRQWRDRFGPVSPKDNLPAFGFTPKAADQ